MKQFTKGLTYGIRITMARESNIGTTFHQAVEIARRIEHIRNQGKVAMMRYKRPHCSGIFGGTSSGGSSQFNRGHHCRLAHST